MQQKQKEKQEALKKVNKTTKAVLVQVNNKAVPVQANNKQHESVDSNKKKTNQVNAKKSKRIASKASGSHPQNNQSKKTAKKKKAIKSNFENDKFYCMFCGEEYVEPPTEE